MSFITRLGQLVLLLLVIQAGRAALTWLLWSLVQPGDSETLRWVIHGAVCAGLGLALLVVARPSAETLGLTWGAASRRERTAYTIVGVLLVLALLSTLAFAVDTLAQNIYAVLIVPACEELLFRGYVWKRVEETLSGKFAGLLTWGIVTTLFGLWHLGYVDAVMLATAQQQAPPLGVIMVFKVMIGLAVGLLAGFARWRTGRVYGAVLLHGLWNLFGR